MNIEEFKNIIEPIVNRNDCMVWGIEILRGKKRITLRIYIDSEIIMLTYQIVKIYQKIFLMSL
jgi:ribosome maturation factor RimP